MEVTIGKKGLNKTWQDKFPVTTNCCHCKGEARVGFVAHEGLSKTDHPPHVCGLHPNKGGSGGKFWLHDCCCVAVYFCSKCLEPTALYNQA